MPEQTKWTTTDTSFTGVPREMIDAALALSDRDWIYPRDVYAEAIEALLDRLDRGETVHWTASRPNTGKKPYHVRMDVGLAERLREACGRHKVRKSIFFLVALKDHLNRNGYRFEL